MRFRSFTHLLVKTGAGTRNDELAMGGEVIAYQG